MTTWCHRCHRIVDCELNFRYDLMLTTDENFQCFNTNCWAERYGECSTQEARDQLGRQFQAALATERERWNRVLAANAPLDLDECEARLERRRGQLRVRRQAAIYAWNRQEARVDSDHSNDSISVVDTQTARTNNERGDDASVRSNDIDRQIAELMIERDELMRSIGREPEPLNFSENDADDEDEDDADGDVSSTDTNTARGCCCCRCNGLRGRSAESQQSPSTRVYDHSSPRQNRGRHEDASSRIVFEEWRYDESGGEDDGDESPLMAGRVGGRERTNRGEGAGGIGRIHSSTSNGWSTFTSWM